MVKIYAPHLYPERVARIYDLLKEEPRTFNEIYRITGLSPRIIAHILHHLKKRNQTDYIEINGRLFLDYPGILRYYYYNLWFLTDTPRHVIEKKIDTIRTISKCGLRSAYLSEKALTEACEKIFGKDAIIVSPFESKNPDVLVPHIKTTFEISIRYDNPINYDYIYNKWIHRPAGYEKTIIFGIEFTKGAIEEAKRYKFIIEKLPFDFPLYDYDAIYKPLFDAVARNTTAVTYEEVVDILIRLIRKHFPL